MPISGRPDRSSFSAIELQGSWLPELLFTGLTEVEDDTCDGALAIRFIIGRDFAVTRSSPESCWDRFAIVSEHTVELKWLVLNNFNKWFHSSRVKFPLVRMSAWFLVSMYLIWIFGSKLIRSNNQSSATLWVLETCLVVGLLPFMIILITASLSSNTYNKASWCEDWTFLMRRLELLILLNCAKLKFVSYTSNLLEQMYDFPKRTMFLQKWILNPQDLPQNQSLETIPVCIVLQCYPHNNIVCIHMYNECEKSIDSGVCHRPFVHFVMDRASFFTDHRISGRPIRTNS